MITDHFIPSNERRYYQIQLHKLTTQKSSCRVASIDSTIGVGGKLDYDKEKYKEMILDVAETVSGYFGFDRSIHGNKKNIGPRKWRWLQELRQEI